MSLLTPEELASLEGVALRAEGVMRGTLQGLHRSIHQGASVEFSDHKEYAPGDELRHVDWRAAARFDHYFVKRYEHETSARVYVLVDGSASMAYGGEGRLTKHAYGAVLGACLSMVFLRQQDSVGALLFDGQEGAEILPRTGPRHWGELSAAMERHRPGGTTHLVEALAQVGAMAKSRAMIFILSDVFVEPHTLGPPLSRLRAAGHEVTLLHLLDGDELELPFQETMIFEGLETGHRLLADPRAIRSQYKELLAHHLDAVGSQCEEAQVRHLLVDTRRPPLEALERVARRGGS